jgi:hypothetical protein
MLMLTKTKILFNHRLQISDRSGFEDEDEDVSPRQHINLLQLRPEAENRFSSTLTAIDRRPSSSRHHPAEDDSSTPRRRLSIYRDTEYEVDNNSSVMPPRRRQSGFSQDIEDEKHVQHPSSSRQQSVQPEDERPSRRLLRSSLKTEESDEEELRSILPGPIAHRSKVVVDEFLSDTAHLRELLAKSGIFEKKKR